MAAICETIEDVIQGSLTFKITRYNGWNSLYCEVCGDGKRTKGPRGGWRFEDEMCFYHCFNCGIDANFDPNREIPYSKEMNKVFIAFGIPKDKIRAILLYKKMKNGGPGTKPKKYPILIKSIEVPDHFYKLSEASVDDIIAIKAKEYLTNVRFIDPNSYPFYLSTGIVNSDNPKEVSIAKSLRNRIIIPSMRRDKMVYWIARSLDPDNKLPYINVDIPKSNIIFGYDNLYSNPKMPLFICEGFFDSFHLNGVAVLENHLTKDQIEIIDKSPKKKILVPDNNGDSDKLITQAIDLGWYISILDLGECKDVTEGIQNYKKLYVVDSIMKNIKDARYHKMIRRKFRKN